MACGVACTAMAALPPRSPDDLAKTATLIVTGTVTESIHSTEGGSPQTATTSIF